MAKKRHLHACPISVFCHWCLLRSSKFLVATVLLPYVALSVTVMSLAFMTMITESWHAVWTLIHHLFRYISWIIFLLPILGSCAGEKRKYIRVLKDLVFSFSHPQIVLRRFVYKQMVKKRGLCPLVMASKSQPSCYETPMMDGSQ